MKKRHIRHRRHVKRAPPKPKGGGFFGAITSIARKVTHSVASAVTHTVESAVHSTAHAVGVIGSRVASIAGDIGNIISRVDSLASELTNFISHTFDTFYHDTLKFITNFPKVLKAAENDVMNFAKGLLKKAEGLINILRKDVFDKIAYFVSVLGKEIVKGLDKVRHLAAHYFAVARHDIAHVADLLKHYALDFYRDILNLGKKFDNFLKHLPDYVWTVIDKYFVKNFIKWLMDTVFNPKFWEMLGEWIIKLLEFILFDS